MKFHQWGLAICVFSPYVSAFQACNLGEEYKVLESEKLYDIRQSNYQKFSNEVAVEEPFYFAPEHDVNVRPSIVETENIFPQTSSLLEAGPESTIVLEAKEATRLLSTLGRSTAGIAKEALEALGPVGDAVAVGLWANEVANSFADETQTSYDRFATTMSLIDWFGVLKLPEREIDRQILTARWNKVAAGEHYSFTLNQNIITQQDKKDIQHWVDLAKGQEKMLESLAQGFATDLALKYQYQYQKALKAQTHLVETLISAVESETNKAIYHQLALDNEEQKYFVSDLRSACRTEVDALYALYPQQAASNRSPMSIPTKREANRALANLQLCQQEQLDLAINLLDDLRNENFDGLSRLELHRLYKNTLDAKIKIVETANDQLERIRTQLIEEMRAEGRLAIQKLFDSGAITQAHQYFVAQADYLAIDEMSRSIFGRAATQTEQKKREFILQKGYSKCVSIGILGGDPNFVGCKKYDWIPAKIEYYDSNKVAAIANMAIPEQQVVEQVLVKALDSLLENGWSSKDEEAWFEQQIISYSQKQRMLNIAKLHKQQVMHWLFDSTADLSGECEQFNGCAGWSGDYLNAQHLSRASSLHSIAQWYESIKNSSYYVHRKRVEQLGVLIPLALESEWKANHVKSFYRYIFPGSIDLDLEAPLIASALKNSNLNINNLEQSLPIAKGIVKTRLSEALSVAEQNGHNWLSAQIGDFQRYIAIIHTQANSTGHYSADKSGDIGLFSEPLPAHILRYMTLDSYQTSDDNFTSYYSNLNENDLSYDARLHRSIDALFKVNSDLGEKIEQLIKTNSQFTRLAGRKCMIFYPQLQKELLQVSGDESLYWLTPLSSWFDNLTRQQLELFGALRFGVIKQNSLNIRCDLNPNNPTYWYRG